MAGGVIEDLDGWTFPLRGLRIIGVTVDHRIRLNLESGVTIGLASAFQLGRADESATFDVRAPAELGPVVALVHASIEHARASWNGLLRIAVSSGAELMAPPSDEIEAWQVALAHGEIYIARPGMGVISIPAPRG